MYGSHFTSQERSNLTTSINATGSVQLTVKGLDIRDHTISAIKIVDRKKVVFNL